MKKIRKKKRTSNTKPARIFKYSPDIILTVNNKRRIHFMSRAMNHCKPNEMIGTDSIHLFPNRIRPWYRQAIKNAFVHQESGRFQYPTVDSIWWEIRIIPTQRDGKVEEVMIIATEITASRIMQAQTIRHARLATIGVLAASIAHEINNPNNAILFNAALLARSWQEAAPIFEEYFQTNGDFSLGGIPYDEARTALPILIEEIHHNTLRVKSIVENLKHLARRDQEILNESVPIHEPLQAAIMILNHKIRKHTDHFEYIQAKTQLTIKGNSRQLEQVFINVLLNALQALTDRTQQVLITTTLETETQPEKVIITIQDQGCGILPTDLTHVTKPFFTTKNALGGTGLGLSISNLIIKNHQGSMHFTSKPNHGTIVTIRLPTDTP